MDSEGKLTHQDFSESPHDDLCGEKPTRLGHLNLIQPEWPFPHLNRDRGSLYIVEKPPRTAAPILNSTGSSGSQNPVVSGTQRKQIEDRA
jgi:hypothetical protein